MTPADHAATVRDAHDTLIEACWSPDDVAEWVAAVDALVALAERATELERERDEALTHCRGPMPPPERIAEAHSRLPRDWFERGYARLANHGVGHFVYHQSPEACYICTMLGLYEDERERAERAETALRMLIEWNERWPSNRVYGGEDIKRVAAEIDEIVEAARDVLGETAP